MAFNNTNTAMDWDSTIENDSTFTLLPEGVYPFTVTGFERARHNGSAKLDPCPKAVLTIEIDGGVGAGNAEALVAAGADTLVAGSGVFKYADRAADTNSDT